METLYERIIRQLDTLVPFLGLAHEEVFDLIRQEHEHWFSTEQEKALPSTFDSYRNQVSQSAFLLGYSYFEAFLADLVREIYRHRPQMLPHEKQIKYSDVLRQHDLEGLIGQMIEREVIAIFYESAEGIAKYFEQRLQIQWPERDGKHMLERVSLVRNCIIHNAARVDRRLAAASDWGEGDIITLAPSDVHEYGIEARDFARDVYAQAESKHPANTGNA
ncbi:MAG TPA: hypothetical protein VMY42_03760 [Thermoguttaceae bacterium]|nr:hypothetical protein [Thermoguttaceae bacterium]